MFGEVIRVIAALALTLGLIGLAVVALRRFGPQTLLRLQGSRAERRLKVIETLVLDPARRLVLVRCDAEERLILLGEGQLIPFAAASEEPAR
jgi:flagellar protein FliO/FliZ